MIPTYIGKSDYCYSNSTSMLLATIGETINPSVIEAITGIGLSAFITKDNLLFISPLSTAPDLGISKALQLLGFSFIELATEANEMPIVKLSANLPAIIGPLDMGFLVNNPNYEDLRGADHYVLAYKVENEKVYFHDPAGFPSVSLTTDQLRPAWLAENILYKRGHYRFWAKPSRIASPSKEYVYHEAMKHFSVIYKENEKIAQKKEKIIGTDAYMFTANRIKEKRESELELSVLKSFSLPISASRSLDMSDLVKEFNANLAFLKREQSQLFGNAQGYAVALDRQNLYKTIVEITKIENQIKELFLNYSD